jgi:radical SAM protein with 4Fe4S-binding SPASM domain
MAGMFHFLYLEATRSCNFNCPECSSGSQGNRPVEEDMPYEVIVDRILEPALKLGTKFIDFSGGEFLLRKDAFKLLEKAHQMGFGLGISTNGSTLDDDSLKYLEKLLGQNLIISLGINSFDEKNLISRQSSESFFLRTLEKAQKYHFRVNVSVTMGSFNKESFEKTIQKVSDLYLSYNRIPFTPRNSSNREWMFSKEDMKDYLHPVLCHHYKGYVSYVPFFLAPGDYERISNSSLAGFPVPVNPSIGCWVGSFYSIGPDGEVAPCPLLSDHLSGGNVLKENLYDILYKSDLFTRIVKRTEFEGKCGCCKYTITCGGCRTYCYFKTGNVFGSDPTCFIDDLSPAELEELEHKTARNFRNYCRMNHFGNKTRNMG